jgi:hypothetical protein
VPRPSPAARWALTPPFHPCPWPKPRRRSVLCAPVRRLGPTCEVGLLRLAVSQHPARWSPDLPPGHMVPRRSSNPLPARWYPDLPHPADAHAPAPNEVERPRTQSSEIEKMPRPAGLGNEATSRRAPGCTGDPTPILAPDRPKTTGAPGRTRTRNLRFTKPLLYQLSYRGKICHYRDFSRDKRLSSNLLHPGQMTASGTRRPVAREIAR